ncbi:LAMI_0G14488g1_1 [Lachancea mirantina]|uniref:LAMI_0G14488g1_1 n=1 Tax=Lachancea mirantina TaxID=1230905 RepID=A0A1G4KC73_9SACH|nr:LAMI_0G14488g1_1 [Lachancea mirantina]
MSKPIKTTSSKIDAAPTPHNTPASVLTSSYLKNGNPVRAIPNTIDEEEINSALASNPQLLASIQEKLGTLVGQDSGYIASLPLVVRQRIYALIKLQRDLFEVEREFQLEMFALEEKYLRKYAPIHKRRFELVSGKADPTASEIEAGKQESGDLAPVAEEDHEDTAEDTQVRGVPSFWLTAFENLPMVSQTLTDRDAEVLDFLVDVRLEYLVEGQPGFRLVFVFSEENPFFSNRELTKAYYYQTELGYSGDFIYDHAEGCTIDWTDNESKVTVAVEKRKQRNKTTKQVRTIEKITPVESFFNFFDPPRLPQNAAAEQGDDEDEDDEEAAADSDAEDLEGRLALDYAIGEEIKDKLIPRAVDWFTGTAMEFEYDGEDGEDFDDDDDDDDEDEDDDDDDDDEDEDQDDDDEDEDEEDDFKNAATSKEQPPECKQS